MDTESKDTGLAAHGSPGQLKPPRLKAKEKQAMGEGGEWLRFRARAGLRGCSKASGRHGQGGGQCQARCPQTRSWAPRGSPSTAGRRGGVQVSLSSASGSEVPEVRGKLCLPDPRAFWKTQTRAAPGHACAVWGVAGGDPSHCCCGRFLPWGQNSISVAPRNFSF